MTEKKCRFCGSTKDLQRHHILYEPEEVINVCKECHREIHGFPTGAPIGGWTSEGKYNHPISVRMDQVTYEKIKEAVSRGRYSNKSEAIRYILRNELVRV